MSGILLKFFYTLCHFIAKFVVSIVVVVRSFCRYYPRSYSGLYRGMRQSLNICLLELKSYKHGWILYLKECPNSWWTQWYKFQFFSIHDLWLIKWALVTFSCLVTVQISWMVSVSGMTTSTQAVVLPSSCFECRGIWVPEQHNSPRARSRTQLLASKKFSLSL